MSSDVTVSVVAGRIMVFAYSSVGSLRHTVELHLRQMVELSPWTSRCPPWHSNLALTGLPNECQVYEDFASLITDVPHISRRYAGLRGTDTKADLAQIVSDATLFSK